MRYVRAIALAAIAYGACYTPAEPSLGDLGRAQIRYVCAHESDPWCEAYSSFPPVIAVGSRFTLLPLVGDIESVAPALTNSEGWFTATKPGTYALFLRWEGKVLDYVHLTFAEPTALKTEPSGPLSCGLNFPLRVRVHWDEMAGEIAPTAKVTPPDLASVAVESTGEVVVTCARYGDGELRIEARGVKLDVPLRTYVDPWGRDASVDAAYETMDAAETSDGGETLDVEEAGG